MKTYLAVISGIFICLPWAGVHAQSVDILWQGETYVPPFYSGKSLWSNQSRITLVAMPQKLGNPLTLNYRWTKNGTVLGNVSGLGRNSLSFSDTVLSRPQSIGVEILGEERVLASAQVTVAPIQSELVVYENNPLYGLLFNRAIGENYKLEEKEVTFTGFPFFFSVKSRLDPSLTYRWRTNVGDGGSGQSETYRIPEGVSGSSKIDITISNGGSLLQRAGKSFVIQFGE